MDKVVCPNGHEYDPSQSSICPECGQAAAGASVFDGFDEMNSGNKDAGSEPQPFMTMFGSFDDFDASEPPPIKTIDKSEPKPQTPPPVRSLKPMPGQQNIRPAQPNVRPQPQAFPPQHGAPVQQGVHPNRPPQVMPAHNQPNGSMNRPPQMQGQPIPQQGQMHGQPVPQQGQPFGQSLHNQPGAYMNRPPQMQGQQMPQGQPMPQGNMPQYGAVPQRGQMPPYGNIPPQQTPYGNIPPQGQPMPYVNMPPRSDLAGAGISANMALDKLVPPPAPGMGDSDVTVALTNTASENKLPVGCLLVLGGPAKGEMYTVRTGDNIIGRSGKGMIFGVDLKFNKKVHRAPQAVLRYDVSTRKYTIAPCSGAQNSFFLNGSNEPVKGAVEINSYDRILIEGTVLMFIGFCGSIFLWETV